MEVDRKLSQIILDYRHFFPFLSITLIVAWQLLLISCNAKIIQLLYCNGSSKGTRGALHK